MTRKLISLLLCLCLISCTVPVVFAVSDEDIYAEIKVEDGQIKTENLVGYWFTSQNDSQEIVRRAGRYGILMDWDKGCQYMRINLDNTLFPKTPEGSSFAVTIDYFDSGIGFFSIRYDGTNNSIGGGIQTDHADVVYMENTQTWRSHTFYIEDADFGGEWQNTDLQIGLFTEVIRANSKDKIIIGGLRIEKSFPQKPIQIELASEEIGNIFDISDEKALSWNLKNVTEVPIDITMNYTIYDEYYNEYPSGKITETIQGGETLTSSFDAPVSADRSIGVYKIKVQALCEYTYKGETSTCSLEGIYDYSVTDKFKEGEARNKRMWTATHIHEQNQDVHKSLELINQAGYGEIRDTIRWADLETTKGKYDFSGSKSFPDVYHAGGQRWYFMPTYGNSMYSDSYTEAELALNPARTGGIPVSEAEKEGYTSYTLAVLERFNGAIDRIELWNEPNHQMFNPLGRTPEQYAEFVKYVYPRIKAKYPNIKIGALSTAAIPLEWIERAFAAGILDYCDAVTVHPYQWTGVFSHEKFHNDLQALHELMEKYGGGDKEVWATEWGFSSSPVYFGLKTAADQARAIVQFYTLGRAYDYIDYFSHYVLQVKNIGNDEGDRNFGIVAYGRPQASEPVENLYDAPHFDFNTTPYSAKKGYLAMIFLNKMMADAENDKIYESPEGIDVLGFKKSDGEKAVVMWSNKQEPEDITFNVTGCGTICDMYGNIIMKLNESGQYTITVDTMPMWIKGQISDIKLIDKEVAVNTNKISIAAGDSFDIEITDSAKRNLRTEVICHQCFTPNATAIKDGNGKISFNSADDTQLLTYEMRLEHYDGDKLIAVNKIDVDVIDAISISVRSRRNASSADRHILDASITNNSIARSYSGSCRISAPTELAESGNTGRFTSLKPGETITIPLNIPRVVEKKYYDVTASVEIDSGVVYSTDATVRFESTLSRMLNPNITRINNTQKTGVPVIDGVATPGEWGEATMVVDSAESYDAMIEDAWKGADDLSFNGTVLWDEENFYFCMNVKDDTHFQNFPETDMWKGDSIQFGIIDGEPDALKAIEYNEFGVALYDENVVVYRSSGDKDQPNGVVTDLSAAAKKTADGVTYEFSIPWSTLMWSGFTPIAEDSVSFNVILNDNDGVERKGWLQFSEGIGREKNAKYFKCFDFAN